MGGNIEEEGRGGGQICRHAPDRLFAPRAAAPPKTPGASASKTRAHPTATARRIDVSRRHITPSHHTITITSHHHHLRSRSHRARRLQLLREALPQARVRLRPVADPDAADLGGAAPVAEDAGHAADEAVWVVMVCWFG